MLVDTRQLLTKPMNSYSINFERFHSQQRNLNKIVSLVFTSA